MYNRLSKYPSRRSYLEDTEALDVFKEEDEGKVISRLIPFSPQNLQY